MTLFIYLLVGILFGLYFVSVMDRAAFCSSTDDDLHPCFAAVIFVFMAIGGTLVILAVMLVGSLYLIGSISLGIVRLIRKLIGRYCG